jgi:hypothetical protein
MATQTGRINQSIAIGGLTFSGSITRTAEGVLTQVVDLAAGHAGAISATGVYGLATGHGILDTDTVDVHWTDPSDGTHKCRRGLAVDTSAANAITFDNDPAAEGDALPAEDTAVVVSVQTEIECAFSGDDLLMIALRASQRCIADIRDAGGSELPQKLVAGEAWYWASDQGVTNPVASDSLTKIVASNGSAVATTLYIGLLLDTVA